MYYYKFKLLARSRSLDFALYGKTPGRERTLIWKGTTVHYRPGTDDVTNIYKILLKGKRCEYSLPPKLKPATILDAGSNIGATTLFFKSLWPEAVVVCCEPQPDNLRLLRKNIESLHKVTIYETAVGARDGQAKIVSPKEKKMVGSFRVSTDIRDDGQTITLMSPESLLARAGLDHFDLIKVDIEGSEYDFLTSYPEEALRKTKWIIGEMHGRKDFEILAYLNPWFDIDIRKRLNKVHYTFNACNRDLTGEIAASFNLKLLQPK